MGANLSNLVTHHMVEPQTPPGVLHKSISCKFKVFLLRLLWFGQGNQKLSFFLVSYVGISMKKFAIGILPWSYFVARYYGTFLLVIRMNRVIQNGPSTYVIKKTSFVKIKVDTCVARELSYSALPCTS